MATRVIRRLPPATPSRDMTAEEVVNLVAGLMRATPMGRDQKTEGKRFDVLLPGGEPCEVKFSNCHPYGNDGFRYNVSNLFGHGERENDGKYFVIVGRRRTRRSDLGWPDCDFFFLWFSRSQLKEHCPRTGMFNLPVNWEPGGGHPKDRRGTVEKHAAISRAVVYAQDLKHAEALVAANPNNPLATARPKVRNTMSCSERGQQALAERVSELEAQLEETQTPRFFHFLKEYAEDIYYPERRLAGAVVVATAASGGVRGLLEQRRLRVVACPVAVPRLRLSPRRGEHRVRAT